jgi:type IV secretory pathway VirB10-like protein
MPSSNFAPPPPPPFPVSSIPPPPPPPATLGASVAKSAPQSSGNDLLDAILNKRLRKTEVEKKQDNRTMSVSAERTDVAAILARRMAVEMTDSEGEDSGSDWSDGDDWSE